jgi:hypothetical protein
MGERIVLPGPVNPGTAQTLRNRVQARAAERSILVAHEERVRTGDDDADHREPEPSDILGGEIARQRFQPRGMQAPEDTFENFRRRAGGHAFAADEWTDLIGRPRELGPFSRVPRAIEAKVVLLVLHGRVPGV